MRSKQLLTVVAAVAFTGLAACSSGTASPGAGTTTPAGSTQTQTGTTTGGGTGETTTAQATGSCLYTGPQVSITLASGGDVNIQNMWEHDLLPAFATACPNIKVNFVFDTHSTNANLDTAKVAAALKQGKTPDVNVTDNFATQAAQADLTQQLSTSDVPALADVSKTALDAYKSGAAPYRGSSVLLAYDSTKISSPPKTLQDLLDWIKANPGKFTYNDPATGGSGYSFVETVVDSKIDPADLAKMQADYLPNMESLWDPGLQVLKGLTPSVYQQVYPKGNQPVLDLLSKGSIEMAPVWSDQFLSAQQTGQMGKDIKVEQISDPSFTGGAAYLAVIKNSSNLPASYALVNWVLQPSQQSVIVQKIAGFPAIPLTKLPADVQGAFTGVDTQDLRPNMSSKMQSDLQKKWAEVVPAG